MRECQLVNEMWNWVIRPIVINNFHFRGGEQRKNLSEITSSISTKGGLNEKKPESAEVIFKNIVKRLRVLFI
ncbi:MAG: hypothetical protein ACI8PB_005227 [Desulforhopalus sp.]|jgi:hypothetical protein